MEKKRPVNLDLKSIKLPLTAYASILHRITGFLLLFIVGFLLYALDMSLDEDGFNRITDWLHVPWIKFLVWLMLSVLVYHFIAGVKHLLMDIGFAEGKESGKRGALLSFILALVCVVLLGVWLW